MQKKEKFIDGVSAIPLIGSILSPIILSILKSPILILALATSGYVAKDYANQDGLTFAKSAVKDKKYSQIASCVFSEKTTSPDKIIPCVEKVVPSLQSSEKKNYQSNQGGQDDKLKNGIDNIVDSLSSNASSFEQTKNDEK